MFCKISKKTFYCSTSYEKFAHGPVKLDVRGGRGVPVMNETTVVR